MINNSCWKFLFIKTKILQLRKFVIFYLSGIQSRDVNRKELILQSELFSSLYHISTS